jgi:hypothetical protein
MAVLLPRCRVSNFYIASDYAGVSGGGISFYYGYEETQFDEWCFVAREGDKEILRLPQSQLGCKDRWNVGENLLAGIGKWLERNNRSSTKAP